MSLIAATDQEFSQLLQQNEKVVVKYYADWCGSCRLFAPKFKRLAADKRFADITFLDINAEQNPEARKAAKVNNLPSFAIFKNGEHIATLATAKEEAVVELIEKLK